MAGILPGPVSTNFFAVVAVDAAVVFVEEVLVLALEAVLDEVVEVVVVAIAV